MNTLFVRARGRLEELRRTSSRLWSEARTTSADMLLNTDGGTQRQIRATMVQAGPSRGPFLVDLALCTAPSAIGLRFDAQRLTLEGAIAHPPSLWGAAAAVDIDPATLSDSELERLFVATMEQIVPPGATVSPFCAAAELVRTRLAARAPVLESQLRPLRAWRRARRERLADLGDLRMLTLRAALRGFWAGQAGARCRIAVIGRGAPALATELMAESYLEVRRVADDELVYTPARDFPGAGKARALVLTGPLDEGVLSEPVDALVLLPGAPLLDRRLATTLQARVVCEAGAGVVLPEADATLAGRRIEVVPDLLFEAARALACRAMLERHEPAGHPLAVGLAAELARLVRALLDEAQENGRSAREQLYLRALGNLPS